MVDITKDKLVSNGSKGVVSYDEVTNDFGTFAKLKAVRVDHLIEYKKAGGAANYDELGEVESLATDFDEVPERQLSAAQQAAHNKAAPEPEFEEEDTDSLPF
ncbi:hypothetical protein D3C85_1747270 [compost metagenome]